MYKCFIFLSLILIAELNCMDTSNITLLPSDDSNKELFALIILTNNNGVDIDNSNITLFSSNDSNKESFIRYKESFNNYFKGLTPQDVQLALLALKKSIRQVHLHNQSINYYHIIGIENANDQSAKEPLLITIDQSKQPTNKKLIDYNPNSHFHNEALLTPNTDTRTLKQRFLSSTLKTTETSPLLINSVQPIPQNNDQCVCCTII